MNRSDMRHHLENSLRNEPYYKKKECMAHMEKISGDSIKSRNLLQYIKNNNCVSADQIISLSENGHL